MAHQRLSHAPDGTISGRIRVKQRDAKQGVHFEIIRVYRRQIRHLCRRGEEFPNESQNASRRMQKDREHVRKGKGPMKGGGCCAAASYNVLGVHLHIIIFRGVPDFYLPGKPAKALVCAPRQAPTLPDKDLARIERIERKFTITGLMMSLKTTLSSMYKDSRP